MAQTTLTATSLPKNTGVVCTEGAGEAINTANTMRVLYPIDGQLIIWVDSNHADTAAVFAVGAYSASGKGTLTNAVANGAQEIIRIDSDRFKNSSGYVEWSWATNSAGFVRAYTIPRD
jgi:hypothetical protein